MYTCTCRQAERAPALLGCGAVPWMDCFVSSLVLLREHRSNQNLVRSWVLLMQTCFPLVLSPFGHGKSPKK